MARNTTPLLLIALCAALALGAGLWLFARAPGTRSSAGVPEPERPPPAVVLPVPETLTLERVDEAPPAATTVLWPLEVELALVRADMLPEAPGLAMLGTGRTAILRGQVSDAAGRAVRARVTFVEGPNEGRVLQADSTGTFGATDLYPGLSVIELEGPGIPGSRRERLLRQRVETLLNVGYGLPAAVGGQVLDEQGVAVAAASVSVDGQVARTDLDGRFFLGGLAAGPVLVEVRHPEHAALRQVLPLTVRATADDLVFRLKPAATLGVHLEGVGRAAGPVQIVVLPANPNKERDFPWYDVNPVTAWPGELVEIAGLPPEQVQVLVFGEGARSEPRVHTAHVRAGAMETVRVALVPESTLEGVVTLAGEPAVGARVRLEAPDRVQSAARWLERPTTAFEVDVWPTLPVSAQEVVTGNDGRFRFNAMEEASPRRYLVASGADGRTRAGCVVELGAREVALALEEPHGGDARLVLELPGRIQGLSAKVTVDGAPREELLVPADQPLRVGDLVDGTWSLVVRWHGEVLLEEPELRLAVQTEREIALPAAAIHGHDREAWERAGRAYPQ